LNFIQAAECHHGFAVPKIGTFHYAVSHSKTPATVIADNGAIANSNATKAHILDDEVVVDLELLNRNNEPGWTSLHGTSEGGSAK
jgi:hypothetical protein